jgi:hypothetical protein
METIMPADRPAACSLVITRDHRYSGQITTGGRRLADVFSDPHWEVVEMRDILVQGTGAESPGVSCGQLLVAKKDILMVVPQGAYEAPIRRQNNYQLKRLYSVTVVLAGYVLKATAHLPDRANPWMLIDDSAGLPAFFGLTEVTMHGLPEGLVEPRYSTVIVNRRRIEAAELSQRPAPRPQPEQPLEAPAFGT